MVNVALCDDNVTDIRILEKILDKYFNEHLSAGEIYMYNNMESLLKGKKSFDIIILDILLKNKNGLHEARNVHKKFPNTNIIFYSNEISYAPESYESYGCGFIVKPASQRAVYTLLDRLLRKINNDKINFKESHGVEITVYMNDIFFSNQCLEIL